MQISPHASCLSTSGYAQHNYIQNLYLEQLLHVCAASLREGHADGLCIDPMLTHVFKAVELSTVVACIQGSRAHLYCRLPIKTRTLLSTKLEKCA
jgi:hypothetical protein